MQIKQTFELPGSPASVWPSFGNLEELVSCLPGAIVTGPVNQDGLKSEGPLCFEVKLGPIAAAFSGKGKLSLDPVALAGCFEGSAIDRKTSSRVKGSASFSLTPNQGSADNTRVEVLVDYSLAGSLAHFNRSGIVQELADAMTVQFADRLRTLIAEKSDGSDIGSESGAPGDGLAGARTSPPRANGTPGAALNPLSLIWLAVRRRFSNLVTNITGR